MKKKICQNKECFTESKPNVHNVAQHTRGRLDKLTIFENFLVDGALKIVIGSYSYTTMPKTTSRVLPTMLCFLTCVNRCRFFLEERK